jgi:hypothetical protein
MLSVVPIVLVAALAAPGSAPAKHRRTHEAPARARPVKRPPAPTPPPVVEPPAPRPLARVQVVAREFSLTLSRQSLPAGRAAVELVNQGQDPHDLRVERADAPATGFSFDSARPRTVASRKLDLTAGDWKLYCTLPGHEALGMSARITVTR